MLFLLFINSWCLVFSLSRFYTVLISTVFAAGRGLHLSQFHKVPSYPQRLISPYVRANMCRYYLLSVRNSRARSSNRIQVCSNNLVARWPKFYIFQFVVAQEYSCTPLKRASGKTDSFTYIWNRWSTNEGKNNAESFYESFLHFFLPSLSGNLSLKTTPIVNEWLVYWGFTVPVADKLSLSWGSI